MTITINNSDITITLTESVNLDEAKVGVITAPEKKIFYCNVDDTILKSSSDINNYEDACKVLSIKPEASPSVSKRVKTIVAAANFLDNKGKIWRENWDDTDQRKYYPAFDYRAGGWVVCYSGYHAVGGFGSYFKKEKTCLFITNKFLDLWLEYMHEGEVI